MPWSTRLHMIKRVRDLKNKLKCFKQSTPQDTSAEATSASKYFDNAGRRRVLTNKALKGKADEVCEGIAVEEFLSPRNLVPINPIGDSMNFCPKLRKNLALTMVMRKCFEQVLSADLLAFILLLSVDLLDLFDSSSSEFITFVTERICVRFGNVIICPCERVVSNGSKLFPS
jgi:hypothetical protein